MEEEEGLEEDDVEVEDDGRSMTRQSTKRPFGAICLITRNVNWFNLIIHTRELINKIIDEREKEWEDNSLEWREEEDCKPFAKTNSV